jgi:hypothetical protein
MILTYEQTYISQVANAFNDIGLCNVWNFGQQFSGISERRLPEQNHQ